MAHKNHVQRLLQLHGAIGYLALFLLFAMSSAQAVDLAASCETSTTIGRPLVSEMEPVLGGGFVDPDYARTERREHLGTDYRAKGGTCVYAVREGQVESNSTSDADPMAAALIVKHSDGSRAVYGHIDSSRQVGSKISRGSNIGKVRNPTESFPSFSSHLHYGEQTQPTDQSLLVESSYDAACWHTKKGLWGWGRAPLGTTLEQILKCGWIDTGAKFAWASVPISSAPDEKSNMIRVASKECPPAWCDLRMGLMLENKYATVVFFCKKADCEHDIGYLKKNGNNWLLVERGTGIFPEHLVEVGFPSNVANSLASFGVHSLASLYNGASANDSLTMPIEAKKQNTVAGAIPSNIAEAFHRDIAKAIRFFSVEREIKLEVQKISTHAGFVHLTEIQAPSSLVNESKSLGSKPFTWDEFYRVAVTGENVVAQLYTIICEIPLDKFVRMANVRVGATVTFSAKLTSIKDKSVRLDCR